MLTNKNRIKIHAKDIKILRATEGETIRNGTFEEGTEI
jgi:hypothetical protein